MDLYFGTGRKAENLNTDTGTTYYNQDISADANWGQTLLRNGLKVIEMTETIGKNVKLTIFEVKNENLVVSQKINLLRHEVKGTLEGM